MEYITAKEASAKWNLSIRRIQTLCNENKIPDVKKFGREWAIPESAERPSDQRIKSGKYIKCRLKDGKSDTIQKEKEASE